MNLQYKDEKFEQYISKIRVNYQKNPTETINVLDSVLNTLNEDEKNSESKQFKILDLDSEKTQIVLYIFSLVILAFMSLFHIGGENPEGIEIYLFSMIFLIAGQTIGTFLPYFGIIFLFSHGGTGIGIMMSTFLGTIFNNPRMTDNPPKLLIIYIGISIFLIVIGFLITVLRNLSNYLKTKQFVVYLPILLYIVGVGMVAYLYRNFDIVYSFLSKI